MEQRRSRQLGRKQSPQTERHVRSVAGHHDNVITGPDCGVMASPKHANVLS